MRPSDFAGASVFAVASPTAFYIWERFWGWRENARELKRWEEEAPLRENERIRTWSETDW
eukprot:jgi/Hompol1/4564/HPOL_003705-RA